MSRAALIEALRRTAADDHEAVWREARAAAETARLDAERAVAAERARIDREGEEAARRLAESATARARLEARQARMAAANSLAERLTALARVELLRFRGPDYERLFSALAAELPARKWQRVRVNPADRSLAQATFPEAVVESDATIVGGLDAYAEEGRIRVSNTLETRLERAWPDLLPGLMAAIFGESHDQRTAA
jgi:vacuolar-type H+-ATPase subunit E/Vma4